jgi:preprotein translocase subunit SecG
VHVLLVLLVLLQTQKVGHPLVVLTHQHLETFHSAGAELGRDDGARLQ